MLDKDFLAKRMRELGINQTELAESVGVSKTMVSRILKGYKQPSLELANRISKELSCTVDRLIKD